MRHVRAEGACAPWVGRLTRCLSLEARTCTRTCINVLTPATCRCCCLPQVDAAINSGNSGGPVLMGDHVVGIAFQCLTSGENIGYIIPVPVINHFLEDLERNGRYTGEC